MKSVMTHPTPQRVVDAIQIVAEHCCTIEAVEALIAPTGGAAFHAERQSDQFFRACAEIERLKTERDAIALKLTREWQQVIAAIAGDVMECLETVKELELNVPGHPFYHGKMSVLMHFRHMADADEQKYLAGASIVAERDQLLSLLASFRAAHAALRAAEDEAARLGENADVGKVNAAKQAFNEALGRLVE